MDFYELLRRYKKSEIVAERIVGAIMDDLSDRRDIKRAITTCDDDVTGEMFRTHATLVEKILADE